MKQRLRQFRDDIIKEFGLESINEDEWEEKRDDFLDKIKIIAQIIFEQLESVPEKAYDEQEDASFNDEYQYRGLANYRDEYEARTEELKKANESLEEKENHIYANILTFMGIFVSIFSLIMVNFSKITKGTLTKGFIVPMNLSLGVVIALFMGLILIFLNKAKSKGFLIAYIVILIILIIMLLVAL